MDMTPHSLPLGCQFHCNARIHGPWPLVSPSERPGPRLPGQGKPAQACGLRPNRPSRVTPPSLLRRVPPWLNLFPGLSRGDTATARWQPPPLLLYRLKASLAAFAPGDADVQLLQLLLVHFRRGPGHEALRLGSLGEGHNLADRTATAKKSDKPVETEG